ncbi:glutamate formimidoyltransferase [bacterium]|nr:glutamate formimidoyltransferase [bacterium]
MTKIIECVPNFSEGRDMAVIDKITAEIKKVSGVRLLDVDPGYDTNRTVVTFVGEPEAVKQAAFAAVKKSHELIDMRHHKGAHPRFGACDVCPVIPVSGVTMDECVEIAHDLGKRLGEELDYPVYFYEYAATSPERRNLATVRSGEYEGLEAKLKDPKWKPDFGPAEFRPTKGATAVSARDFLIAYNINLNTTNAKKANAIALRLREQGYPEKDADGNPKLDANGKKIMHPGMFKNCKAIGWYVDDFKRAQISINLTNYHVTNMFHVFDAASKLAEEKGLRVTGSEIVGVLPKEALIEAGIHYLEKQGTCAGQSEAELIKIAEQSLGLSDVVKFKPEEKVIEYMVKETKGLSDITVTEFSDLLASDAPAPGGGSVAALCGSLAAALGSMVANLTYNKKGYKEHNEKMNTVAKDMQVRRAELLHLIDKDTNAFNIMMAAMKAQNAAKKAGNPDEIAAADKNMDEANKYAISVPLQVMEKTYELLPNLKTVGEFGNINAASDAGVGALLVQAGVKAAGLNVKINLKNFAKEDPFYGETFNAMNKVLEVVDKEAEEILAIVDKKIS